MKRATVFAVALLAAWVAQVSGQAAPAPTPAVRPIPEVGATAPDFTLPGATRYGLLGTPVKLSDFRGKTVVLAFFPAARTRGCTVQMRAYRDQYSEVFNNGRNVVVIGISTDPIETLRSWAAEEDFPLIFASDTSQRVAGLYGAVGTSERASRNLFVVDPQGRIAYRALPFREVDPTSYDALAAEVDKLQPGR